MSGTGVETTFEPRPATAAWTAEEARSVLRLPTTSDDKYSRGVLGLRTGSTRYPGAAVLGVEAAWRTGLGMVRYVGPERAQDLILARRPETVTAEGRVQAWLIGSGTDAADRSPDEDAALRSILAGEVPVVVDAGALDLAAEGSAPRVLTPHGREHDRLREMAGLVPIGADADDSERERAARETARALGATVLLKGATTVVATPGGWVRRVTTGTPWLATAGTGDVLAGVIGAVVAGATVRTPADVEHLGALAATGAWVHGRAATEAAARHGGAGGPITALDITAEIARTVAGLLAGDDAARRR
ncbi:NAD(P)H-hydrate dehydratase [Microbacterium sp. P06]|uniref:ADP-dependent NAD(P)H-hydrate dehydratase n=1 Tax=Microbacterium sp. P06 TaxID=3366949 RepID=UPI0037455F52